MTFEQAVSDFQAKHGADWYIFINSPLWRAARAIAMEYGPNRKLPGLGPQEILAHGAVFAANIQGWQDFLQTLEGLLVPGSTAEDPMFHPTYQPDEPLPEDRPAPAPEAQRHDSKPKAKRK